MTTLSSLFNWFQLPESYDNPNTRDHILRGFTKSFLAYLVPISLYRRRVNLRNFRRAVALGAFVSGVRAVDDILAKLKQIDQKEQDSEVEAFVKKYSLGVAAFMSALVAIIIDGEVQNSITIVLWTAVRALRNVFPDVPFGSTIVMCLSSAHILSTWLTNPEEQNPAYVKFLDIFGGKSSTQMARLRQKPIDGCVIIHPGQGCIEHFIDFFIAGLPRAFRLYLPVYLLSFVFSSGNIRPTLIGLCRSTIFLSLYCSFAWLSSCMVRATVPGPWERGRVFMHTWFAGLATLVESKRRAAELAAYCLTYALEACFRYTERRGYVSLSPSLNMFILALSAGVLLHHRDQQPRALVRWLFKLRR